MNLNDPPSVGRGWWIVTEPQWSQATHQKIAPVSVSQRTRTDEDVDADADADEKNVAPNQIEFKCYSDKCCAQNIVI